MTGTNRSIAHAGRTGIRKALPIAVLSLCGAVSPGNAEPVVIHDSGNTRPITDYLFMPRPESLPQPTAVPPAPNPESLASRIFPVHTLEMTPGEAQVRTVDFPQLPRPIFLIGTDDRSRNWLLRYRGRLEEVQAIGLVVEAGSEQDFLSIKEIAGGLEMASAPASGLPKRLDLRHYPILITRTLIEQ